MTLKLRLAPRPTIIARVTPRLSGATLVAGDNIDIDQVGNEYTISADLSAVEVTLIAGDNIDIDQVDNTYTIAANVSPIDSLAYNGMQINGSMDVSQERGTTAITPNASEAYLIDGWKTAINQSGAAGLSSGQTGGNQYFVNSIYISANTSTTFATGGYAILMQRVEGYRAARLNFGTAQAESVTIGFWVYSGVACTMCVSLRNNAATRSYVTDVTVDAAITWQYKTVTIPGDTTGTWLKDNGNGLVVTFTFACGATYITPADTWIAGNFLATPQITNPWVSTACACYITGVVMLPGTVELTEAKSPLIMRPYDQELVTCQRYYYKRNYLTANIWGPVLQAFTTQLASGLMYEFPVPMRIAPTFSTSGTFSLVSAAGVGQAITGGAVSTTTDYAYANSIAVASGLVAGNATMMASAAADQYHVFDARL